jgi:hypothetical protein
MEQAGAKILLAKADKSLRTSSDHCMDFLSRKIQEEAVTLQNMYADVDGRKLDEISEIAGEGSLDVWHSFYNRIRESKDYTKKYSDHNIVRTYLSLSFHDTHRLHSLLIFKIGFRKPLIMPNGK